MRQRIAELPSFSEWPSTLRQALDAQGRLMTVLRGRSVIELGSETSDVYIVVSGALRVTQISQSGREVIFRDAKSGDMFGEFSALDHKPRSASIFALEESKVLVVKSDQFLRLIHAEQSHVDWMFGVLIDRLRALTDKVFELSALSVRNRLHCEIIRLAGTGVEGEKGIVVEPAPTHNELAARIGAYRETVSREISYLSKKSMLELRRKKLIIMDLPGIVGELSGHLAHETFPPAPHRKLGEGQPQ